MDGNTLYTMIFDGVEPSFLLEIILRSLFMFVLILVMLRISGRRGVRQLTLFEVAIILGLGSAAGDPMFQDDFPLAHAVMVFITVILFYKLITWLAARFDFVNHLLEGEIFIIVRDGEFAVTSENKTTFTKMEFFSELRNASIEHLGQVRMAVLEIDGSLSVLRYADDEVKYGLPLFPDHYKEIKTIEKGKGPVACMFCGNIEKEIPQDKKCCKCHKEKWTYAINSLYH